MNSQYSRLIFFRIFCCRLFVSGRWRMPQTQHNFDSFLVFLFNHEAEALRERLKSVSSVAIIGAGLCIWHQHLCYIWYINMRFRVNKTSIFLFQGAGYVGVELAAGLAEACGTPILSPLTFGWMKYDHRDHHLFWQSQVLPDAAASGQIALFGSRFLPGPMGILNNTIPRVAGLWRPFFWCRLRGGQSEAMCWIYRQAGDCSQKWPQPQLCFWTFLTFLSQRNSDLWDICDIL